MAALLMAVTLPSHAVSTTIGDTEVTLGGYVNLDFIYRQFDYRTPFIRQPMLRYTTGGLDLSLENPDITVTDAMGGRVTPDQNTMPDTVTASRDAYRWAAMTSGLL